MLKLFPHAHCNRGARNQRHHRSGYWRSTHGNARESGQQIGPLACDLHRIVAIRQQAVDGFVSRVVAQRISGALFPCRHTSTSGCAPTGAFAIPTFTE